MEEKKNNVSKFFLYVVIANYAVEGLAETLPGVTWPKIANDLGFKIGLISVLTTISYIGAGLSSIVFTKIRRLIGTNYSLVTTKILFFIGLYLYAFSESFATIGSAMFIIGVAIGAEEVNVDSYVIKAYDASWESIVHAFGFIGPIAVTLFFSTFLRFIPSYKYIYVFIMIILFLLIVVLLLGKRHWLKRKLDLSEDIISRHSVSDEEKHLKISFFELVRKKNVLKAFMCFFLANGVSRLLTVCLNSIIVSQKNMPISLSALATALYFGAVFFGRMILGGIVKKVSIKTIIRISAVMSIVAFLLFYIDINNEIFVCFLATLIGFATASFIPFVAFDMKNCFDISILSTILGYGEMMGLFGVSAISAIMAIVTSFFSVKATQIVLIVLTVLFVIVHGSLKKINYEEK